VKLQCPEEGCPVGYAGTEDDPRGVFDDVVRHVVASHGSGWDDAVVAVRQHNHPEPPAAKPLDPYEVGYREGESNHAGDWLIALSEVEGVPDEVAQLGPAEFADWLGRRLAGKG
jgi:hypothetical protein